MSVLSTLITHWYLVNRRITPRTAWHRTTWSSASPHTTTRFLIHLWKECLQFLYVSDHCLKAFTHTFLGCCPIWGSYIWRELTLVKDCPHTKKKNSHILILDNRHCHSKPIIVSIIKSAEQKRATLSFPYVGPCVWYNPLFISSCLLITLLFASE